MSILNDHADAMLLLLDYMVGIDEYIDPTESKLFVQHVLTIWPGDLDFVQQKFDWIAGLWRQHSRDVLLLEACALLKSNNEIQKDLVLLKKMAAVDGTIDPREQKLFDTICTTLGVSSGTLTLDV